MAGQPDLTLEQRELKLVSAVDFKILTVANDEPKLQQVLDRYLAPLLLKAASEHASVRTKVITMCQRLKTFIQPPDVLLPVAALLDQYKSTKSPIVKQLDLTFIQYGLPRLSPAARRALAPKLFADISTDAAAATGSAIFNMLLTLIPDLNIPIRGSTGSTPFRDEIGLSSSTDAAFVASWLGRVLLARMPPKDDEPPLRTIALQNRAMTSEELEFLRMHQPEGRRLFSSGGELRLLVAKFIASAAFTDEERLLPAVYAAGCADTNVSAIGEELLKRTTASLEDEDLVRSLFDAHAKLPAPYRIRILGLLAKSTRATSMSSEVLRLVEIDSAKQQDHPTRQFMQPVSALQGLKLHKALFQFLASMTRSSAVADEPSVAPEIIHRMHDYIEQQGWPVPNRTSTDDLMLRSSAYEMIGALVARGGRPLSKEETGQLAPWLFRSLSEDPSSDVVVSIDGALSSLGSNLRPSDEESKSNLVSLLLAYMLLPDEAPAIRSARHAAVKWANRCLPYSDVQARWIDVLGAAGRRDERSDVVEEAHKGLDPWSHVAHANKNEEVAYPKWQRLVGEFFGRKIKPSNEQIVPDSRMDVDGEETTEGVFTNFSNDKIRAFPLALNYCRKMLFLAAAPGLKLGLNWESVLEAQVQNDGKTRRAITEHLVTQDEASIEALLRACLAGATKGRRDIVEGSLGCFVQVAVFCPQGALGKVAHMAKDLLPHVFSTNDGVRSLAVKAFGILGAHPAIGESAIQSSLEALRDAIRPYQAAVGEQLSKAEGALVALAHLRSRLVYYGMDRPGVIDEEVGYETMLVEAKTSSLRLALVRSCGQLWTAGLRLKAQDAADHYKNLVQSLATNAKAGNETAIWALGRLAIVAEDGNDNNGSIDSGPVGGILTELLKLYELRQVEVHFAVGEAIAAATARWDSSSVQLTLDVDTTATTFRMSKRGALLTAVLDKLFADCKATKPSLLKASGVWLFSVVQYCSGLGEVQSRLREAQAAFMRLLSARDELVQETASRGLELVYERGDEGLRGDLVHDLVAAFTGSESAGSRLKVDEETELFEPGALATGDGKSVTSYRDIVNLAQEVGDQSLVYRFMSLANNAATWSTRSAFGRFGLSTILSEGSAIDAQIWPKLFRYRFDPDSNVRRSMSDIWRALARDEKAVMAENFDAIMEDLLKNMLTKEWRVREASCAAVADLIAGQPFERYGRYYAETWAKAARVLDDIKGSVRAAALRLSLGLANTLARQLEESGTSSATKAMMADALPFLTSAKGVESGVREVQVFAIVTVLKLVKAGGAAMKPYIPALLPQLLGLLSTIEPEQISYGYQRLGEEQREALDRLRSSMVRQSPLSDAVDELLRHVDAAVFAELAPRLRETVKTALALPTKIAAGGVIATLFTRNAATVAPEAAALLDLLKSHVFERNDEASKGYAHAASYVLRAASATDQVRYFQAIEDAYFTAEDDSVRRKAADAIVAVSKISPDVFFSHEVALLPLSFFGARDLDEYSRKGFGDTWDAHAGTARTTARYVREIAGLAGRALDAARWDLRHAGALAVAGLVEDAASAAGETTGSISPSDAKVVWPLLERALALKTFAGKEKVIIAFPKFIEKAPSIWRVEAGEGGKEGSGEKTAVAAQLSRIAVREAKRSNDDYRPHALGALAAYTQARPDVDLVDEIGEIVKTLLTNLADDGDDDEEMRDVGKDGGAAADAARVRTKEEQQARIVEAGVKAVMGSWTEKMMAESPARILTRLEKALPWLELVDTKVGRWGLSAYIDEVRRTMDSAAAEEEKKKQEKKDGGQENHRGQDVGEDGNGNGRHDKESDGATDDGQASNAARWFRAIGIANAKRGHEAQRLARARAAKSVARAWKAGVWGADGGGRTRDHLRHLALYDGMEGERSNDVAEAWRGVAESLAEE